jgi:hypothetical protein
MKTKNNLKLTIFGHILRKKSLKKCKINVHFQQKINILRKLYFKAFIKN